MNIGNFFIIFSLILSATSIFLYLFKKDNEKLNSNYGPSPADYAYLLTSLLLFFSLIMLTQAFINYDFRFSYVFFNSDKSLPFLYRISAVWAGKEGSFLLWAFIQNILGVIVLFKEKENKKNIMAVIIAAQILFLIILLVESPFKYIWDMYPKQFQPGQIPMDGQGMTALLVNPWMVIHPPILFLGYASATIPFAYLINSLITKDFSLWIKKSYKWLLFSMTTLGLGIFLGGYWSYVVLGWGGYWGWDPVENSSLIPWLISVALMHGMLLQKRKQILAKTNILLGISYIILIYYSTFLTRSGILSNFSVHSFGDSTLSTYLVSFILIYLLVSLYLFFTNFKDIKSNKLNEKLLTFENLTLAGIILLVFFAVVILIGTSMPILSGMVSNHPTSPTRHFYDNLSFPFGVAILLALVTATTVTYKQLLNKKNIILFAVLSLIFSFGFNFFAFKNFEPKQLIAYVTTAIAAFVAIQSIYDLVKLKTSTVIKSRLTHIGLAIMVIGMVSSNFHSITIKKRIVQNQKTQIGPIEATFKGDLLKKNKKYLSLDILESGEKTNVELPYYIDKKQQSLYREPHIINKFSGDIYITPENYISGKQESSILRIRKGETKKIGDVTVHFKKFKVLGMESKDPKLIAQLEINSKPINPEITFQNGQPYTKAEKFTKNRTIMLMNFKVADGLILLKVDPKPNGIIPPDSVIIQLSMEKYIWIVWLGTILITIGGLLTLILYLKKEEPIKE